MCDARLYFICHIYVYQDKNGENMGIHKDVEHMLTTQKAVANTLICGIVSNNPMEYHEIYTDNSILQSNLQFYHAEAVGFQQLVQSTKIEMSWIKSCL